MPGMEDLIRVIDNLYTRVFEQAPPHQNARLSDVVVLNEDQSAETDTGNSGATHEPVTARAYEDLTVTGADGAQGDGSYRVALGTRIQYGSGVLDFTDGAVTIRFETTFAYDTVGDHYLFSVTGTGSEGLFCWYRAADDLFVFTRVGATTTGTITVSGGTFVVGAKFTLTLSWDSTTIYISLDGAARMSQAHSDIPTGIASQWDIGSNEDANHADVDFFWLGVVEADISDFDASDLDNLGDTDPLWSDFSDTIPWTLLWLGVNGTHEVMSNRAGETNAV